MTTIEDYAAQPRALRLARLARTADELHAAISRAPSSDALVRRPAPDAWAPVEVIGHLRDTEEWFLMRCRWAIDMDEPRFPRNNPDRWAADRQYLRHDAALALDAFRRWRAESLTLLGALSDGAWSRGGVHMDSRGRRSIDEFLSVMAWHDENHLAQLLRALDGRA